jgi:shikimate dehydrogenase
VTISGETRVVGVIGDPVEHSLSPIVQNAALRAAGLNWVYLPFHVRPDSLPSAIGALRALNLVGFNVTIPHKERVLRLIDEVDPYAAWLGAVNTIGRADGGRLKGWNTDGAGFLASLAEAVDFQPQGTRVVILGAGGAARAIAGQLCLSGVSSLTIVNRTYSRAEKLVEWLQSAAAVAPVDAPAAGPVLVPAFGPAMGGQGTADGPGIHPQPQSQPQPRLQPCTRPKPELTALAWDDAVALARAIEQADLLVQATAYGMHPQEEAKPPVPASLLHPGLVVCDIVYRPLETALLREAKARGAHPVNGLGMLVHQGAASFTIWTGLPAPVAVMRQALADALSPAQRTQ